MITFPLPNTGDYTASYILTITDKVTKAKTCLWRRSEL